MCSRARLSPEVSEIKITFRIPPERPTPNFAVSWNVAPTDPAAGRPLYPRDRQPAHRGRFDNSSQRVVAGRDPSQFGSRDERHDLPHKLIHRFALLGDIGARQIDVEVPDAQSLVLPQIVSDFVGSTVQKGPWRRQRFRHHDGSRNRNCHLVFCAPGVAQQPPQAGHFVRHFRRS